MKTRILYTNEWYYPQKRRFGFWVNCDSCGFPTLELAKKFLDNKIVRVIEYPLPKQKTGSECMNLCGNYVPVPQKNSNPPGDE